MLRIKRLIFGTTREDMAGIGFDDSLIYEVIKGEAEADQLEIVKQEWEGCLEVLEEWRRRPGRRVY